MLRKSLTLTDCLQKRFQTVTQTEEVNKDIFKKSFSGHFQLVLGQNKLVFEGEYKNRLFYQNVEEKFNTRRLRAKKCSKLLHKR